MPTQDSAAGADLSSYSLTKDRERRSTQGNRPARAEQTFAEMDKLKSKQAATASRRQVAAEAAARPQPPGTDSLWPERHEVELTDDPTENAKRKAENDANYYCAVIAHRTGENVYPFYQTGRLQKNDLFAIAFPQGAANIDPNDPPAQFDLRESKKIPPVLQMLINERNSKIGHRGKGRETRSTNNVGSPVRSQATDALRTPGASQSATGVQVSRNERPVLTNAQGKSLYPGITRSTAPASEVQSRFAKDKPAKRVAPVAARQAGHPPLQPTDHETVAHGVRVGTLARAHPEPAGKAPKVSPAKHQRKQITAVNAPPATSTSVRATQTQGTKNTATSNKGSPSTMSHRRQAEALEPRRESVTTTPAQPTAYGTAHPTRSATRQVGRHPSTLIKRNAQANVVRTGSGSVGIDNLTSFVTGNTIAGRGTASSVQRKQVHQPQQTLRPAKITRSHKRVPVPAPVPHQPDLDDYYLDDQDPISEEDPITEEDALTEEGPIAENDPIPEGEFTEGDDTVLEMGPVDDGTRRTVGQGVPPARFETVRMTDGTTKKKLIVHPDLLPPKGETSKICRFPALTRPVISLAAKIAKPWYIAQGTFHTTSQDRSDKVKPHSCIDQDAFSDAVNQLNLIVDFDSRYLHPIMPQIRAYRSRSFESVASLVFQKLGFDPNAASPAEYCANVEKYKLYKGFAFIYPDPVARSRPFDSDFFMSLIIELGYKENDSIGWQESDLFLEIPDRFIAFAMTMAYRVICLFKEGQYDKNATLSETRETGTFSHAQKIILIMKQTKGGDWVDVKQKILRHARQRLGLDDDPFEDFNRAWSPDGAMSRRAKLRNIWDEDSYRQTPEIVDGQLVVSTDNGQDVPEIYLEQGPWTASGMSPKGHYGSDGVLADEDPSVARMPSPRPISPIESVPGSPDDEMMEGDDVGDVGAQLF
ncbi:hypothetical protein RSOLAG22IIIB_11688 [Rhizoctonia solani]|uniref:DUF6532 domain-containing protein n=1 Tax=Rhizoctonia solani TaxID=456999 RepID=A0A0K6GA47_9AGAM|nr:unnamed protein product [Rhizoctonia solani]CUA75366.1 hypothetical protein RSOLAG22IIIB_11688 [Rhizoctonia solani]